LKPRLDLLTSLEDALGHHFIERDLLNQALRHRSAAHERGGVSSERLEFLGDAALSHAIAALLFERWPDASEGELTRARAALVRERSLAERARELGIGQVLEVGGGLKSGNAGPSLLADAFEAVLGALLVDGGWRVVRRVVRRLFTPHLDNLKPDLLGLEEPKSVLQEYAQKRGLSLPIYRELTVRGPAHGRVYVFEVELAGQILGSGEGSSKREAQQAAARLALENLDLLLGL
jgi:ribonuclease III